MKIVVMGVSGSGKSTVGNLLASKLGIPFVDADQLHSPANKRKMAAGIPLDDDDRVPWLRSVAEVLAGAPVVVACSVLKRRYRDVLRGRAPNLRLVYLQGLQPLLCQRLASRTHEFMPSRLLDSQLQILEPPQEDEAALTVSIVHDPEEIVELADRWVTRTGSMS